MVVMITTTRILISVRMIPGRESEAKTELPPGFSKKRPLSEKSRKNMHPIFPAFSTGSAAKTGEESEMRTGKR